MKVKPLDTLLAVKAICLAPNLKENERRVGTVLIEHFNRDTNRCDPSHARISELLSLSTRTVMRALRRLVTAGLFRVDRHGGYSGRNSYEVVWPKLHEILAVWNAKFKAKVHSSSRSSLSHAPRQACHLRGDSAVTQTYGSNLLKKTCEKRVGEKGTNACPSSSSKPGVSKPSSTEAARAAAERRWMGDLHQMFAAKPVTYGEVIGAIDEDMRNSATAAELQQRGTGLTYIVTQLGLPKSNA